MAFVHSLALDRSVWDGVVQRLEGEAEVLTYDCRGHGRSDRHAGAYTAQLFARDLAELFDHVGWQSAVVAGCSMGGNVAQAFAAVYPQRTAALGLIDTTAWYGADAPAKFKERADAAKAKSMSGLIDFQLTRWFSDEFRASHPDMLKRTTEIFVANDVDCYAASCSLLGHVDSRQDLRIAPHAGCDCRRRGGLRDARGHGPPASRRDSAVDTDDPSARSSPDAYRASGSDRLGAPRTPVTSLT